jgi:hypothetical protein
MISRKCGKGDYYCEFLLRDVNYHENAFIRKILIMPPVFPNLFFEPYMQVELHIPFKGVIKIYGDANFL